MLLPEDPQDSPNPASHKGVIAKLGEALTELDALGCHIAAAHLSMAISALSNVEKD